MTLFSTKLGLKWILIFRFAKDYLLDNKYVDSP